MWTSMMMVPLRSMKEALTQPLKQRTVPPLQQFLVYPKQVPGQVLQALLIQMMQMHTQWDGESLYHLFLHNLVRQTL